MRLADVYRDPPLTEEELRANYDRARSFAVRTDVEAELLSKPLDEDAGGIWHDGGDIFESRGDREYQAIHAWIDGAGYE